MTAAFVARRIVAALAKARYAPPAPLYADKRLSGIRGCGIELPFVAIWRCRVSEIAIRPSREQLHQRVGAPGQSMSHRAIAAQVNQVATRFGVKEAGADHATTRIAAELIRKRLFRVPEESGYNCGKCTPRIVYQPVFVTASKGGSG